MKEKELSKQAQNFVSACKGGSINTIHGLLHYQSQSIKDELMVHYKADSYDELALRLSQG
jgi:hypothetical protein